MKLGETVTYCGFEEVFLGGSIPMQTALPNTFGGRDRFDVNASHVFPQGVLATVTLVRGVAGDGEANACTEFKVGLPLC